MFELGACQSVEFDFALLEAQLVEVEQFLDEAHFILKQGGLILERGELFFKRFASMQLLDCSLRQFRSDSLEIEDRLRASGGSQCLVQ